MEYAGTAFGIIGKTKIFRICRELQTCSREFQAVLLGDFGRFLDNLAVFWANAEMFWHFSAFHDRVLEAVNLRALAQKIQLTNLDSKEAVSRRIIGRIRYIAWVKCPYRVAGKASALRAGKRAPG
jgi:hypothetical protein